MENYPMKLFSTLSFLTFSMSLFAQSPMIVSYQINLDSVKTIEKTAIQPLFDAFPKYIKRKKELKNYMFYGDPIWPTTLSDVAISKQKLADFKGFSFGQGIYLASDNTEKITSDGNDIFRNGDLILENGSELSRIDTIQMENIFTGEFIEKYDTINIDYKRDSKVIGFSEHWETKDGEFNKNVVMLSAGLHVPFHSRVKYLTYYNFKTTPEKSAEYEKMANELEYDVVFENKKENTKAEHPASTYQAATKDELVYSIFDQIFQSELSIENAVGKKIDTEEFMASFKLTDTVYVENIFTGEFEIKVVTSQYQLSDIVGFRFTEEWQILKTGLGVEKKVKKIQLLILNRNDKGDVLGYKTVNDYYIIFDAN
jgi:hypothetical protein